MAGMAEMASQDPARGRREAEHRLTRQQAAAVTACDRRRGSPQLITTQIAESGSSIAVVIAWRRRPRFGRLWHGPGGTLTVAACATGGRMVVAEEHHSEDRLGSAVIAALMTICR
jgi:hypothetical protein